MNFLLSYFSSLSRAYNAERYKAERYTYSLNYSLEKEKKSEIDSDFHHF
jgi:hypothetical protein